MKKIYSQYFAVFYFLLMLFVGINKGNAQVIKPFKERTSSFTPARTIYKIKGDFTMIGNTNLTLQNYAVDRTNGANAMAYVDKDNDNQTHNSSAATLDLLNDSGAKLTNCYNIVYAGLYWTGRVSDANMSPNSFSVTKNGVTKTLDKRKILFKGPSNNNYNEFTATDIYFPTNADNNIYTAYAEVTDFVRTNGVGEYFAANIAATEGADGGDIGKFAGWGLVVVYENSTMKNRDITVFDGHAFVSNNIVANHTLPVSGFNSAMSGAVGVKLGVMAGEGDVNYEGDYLQIQKLNTSNYLFLSRPGNSTNNFFNSSINTGGNNRNPNLVNNSGLDISMFYLPNENKDIIGNNQTSTTFKYGSTVDSYAIFSIVMAVDAYVPEIEGVLSTTSINGNNTGAGPYTVLPGQELGYKIQIKNKGSEAVQNSKIVIPIPYNATFVDGSLTKTVNFTPLPTPNSLTYQPTTGANGSIVWDLGTLPLSANSDAVLAELTFKLKATENCVLLKNSNCNNVIQVNGVLSGKGSNSGVTVADKSLILGYTNSGSCSGTSIAAPLQTTINSTDYTNANCQATSPTIAFTFCNTSSTIPVTDVTGSFPTGSTFYNAYPVTAGTTAQYTINNPFPATVGTSIYYAIPPGGAGSGCYFQFSITVESITTTPTVAPVNYCIGDTAVALTAVASKPEYTLYYYLTSNSTAQQSIIPSTATAGQFTYYVAEGKTNACIGPKKQIVVNVNAKPTIVITNPLPICAPATSLDLTAASITNGSSSGLTFTYWTDAAATTPLTNFSTAIPGTYYIKGTNVSNCFDIKPVVVTKSIITLTELMTSHIDVKCFNESTGSITVNNASGGIAPYTYSWKKNGIVYNSTSQTLNNLGSGTYEVTATDANGCQETLTITILQPVAALTLGNSSKKDVLCYGENTGSVTAGTVANAVGTVTYSWKNSANVEVGTTALISNLPAGAYTLTVTDSCSSQSNSVIILQPTAALSCSVIQNKAVSANGLSNGEATITPIGGNGGYTYLWDNNETTPKAIALSAGSHSVTVTDSNGCTTTCAVIITEPHVLSCSISQDSPVKCFGENTGKATITALGGNGDYTYLWDNGETNSQAIALGAGSHTATVTDKFNYTTTCTVTISQPQSVLSATKTQTDVTCGGGTNGSATVNVSGGTAGYSYSWNTNPVQSTATASNLASGNYTVLVTDDNGCSISESFTILDGDAVVPVINPLPNVTTINCPSEPTFEQAVASDNNGTISSLTYVDATTPGNCAGSYIITRTWAAKDTCGNTSLPVSQTIIVQDNTAPIWTTLTSSLNKTIECSDVAALANAQALFPTASDSCDADVTNIVKVSGQFIASATCTNAGTYTNTWTVKDDCGNTSDTFTQVITIHDTTAPVFTGNLPQNTTVSCDAVPQPAEMTASDNCNGDLPIVFTETKSNIQNGCPTNYTLTRIWKTSDCAGNAVSYTQIITVRDTTPPTGTAPANVINLASANLIPTGTPADMKDAADNCSSTVNITVADATGACDGNVYLLTRTYTLTDCAGNKTELVQTFTVNCKVRKNIVANDDNAGPINGVSGGTNIINVLTNDTLNGATITINDVTLTTTIPDPKGALTLNADGSVNVAPNTPAGTYTLTYQICEKADFGNCDTAIVTVTVTTPAAPPTPVVANDDTYSNIGCNTFGLVGNVLSNDLKGTTPVTLELVNFTLTSQTNPNITIDNSGNVTISSLTPAGTYIYNYRICDKLSAANCDTATITITVVPNGVTTFKSTACTDDSSLINLTTLLPEGSPITGTWIDKSNSNTLQGSVFNPFGLALGNYTFEYIIADEKCPRSIVLEMEVNDDCKVLACEKVLPRNAFSPNGDSMNETFKIDNIDEVTCYPSNTVEIYNRWGILVFETTNYNNLSNAFDGTSKGRTTIKQSDGLPTGTYFYIIKYTSFDGTNTLIENKLDGYLYLSR